MGDIMEETIFKMNQDFNKGFNRMPSKGGLIGALLGALASVFYHKRGDRPIKNAGKTALLSGAGYLLGQWIERLLARRHNRL
jgi:hypothetical protein